MSSPHEPRQEAEDTPKTMSFMHLHLGLEGALPNGTDVSSRLATLATIVNFSAGQLLEYIYSNNPFFC